MQIVRMQAHHIEQMAELEKLCFPVPWTKNMLKSELRSPIAFYVVMEDEGRVLAYAGMQAVLDEGHITNIAAHPEHRRQGLARRLLETVIEEARRRELSFLDLEVRQSNVSAQALYTALGFTVVGTRQGYYERPREDALLMTLTLPTKGSFSKGAVSEAD